MWGSIIGAVLGGVMSHSSAKKQSQAMKDSAEVQKQALEYNKQEYDRQLQLEKEWTDTFGYIDENVAQFAQHINTNLSAQYRGTQLEQATQHALDNTYKLLSQRGYEVSNGIEASLTAQIEQNKQIKMAEIQATAPMEQLQTAMDVGNWAYSHKPQPQVALGNMTTQANSVATGLRSLGAFYGERAQGAAQFGGQLGGMIAQGFGLDAPQIQPQQQNLGFAGLF